MSLKWFKVINETEFLALDLPSKMVTLEMAGVGIKDILVTRGNRTSLLYEGIFLSLGLNDRNPFVFDNVCAYKDTDNDIWIGVLVED